MRTAALVAFVGILVIPHASGAWAQFQADPARTGSDGLYAAGTGAELWRTQMDRFAGHGGSAVADGVLYRADAGGNVWAIDAETGEALWSADVNAGFGAPAAAGSVFVGVAGPGLVALDPDDGSVRWRTELRPADDDVARASPAASGGLVAWTTPHGQVVVLGTDGDLRWNRTLGSDVRASPLIVDATLYAASDTRDLWAFELDTGEVLWRYPLGSGSDAAPAYADGVVFQPVGFGFDEGVHAVDATDGTRVWYADVGPCGGATVQAGRVFALCEDHLIALDAEDGHEIWRADLHPTSDPVAFGTDEMPVALGPVVVAGEPDRFGVDRGNMTAFDAVDGSVVWRTPLETPSSGFPAAAHGRLYVATNSFPLIALELGGPGALPLPPAPFWQVDAGVAPEAPRPGEDVAVTAHIVNAGPESGSAHAVLRMDGAVRSTRDIERDAYATGTETWSLQVPAGQHTLEVQVVEAGTVAASMEVTVMSGTPDEGTPVPVALALGGVLLAMARARR